MPRQPILPLLSIALALAPVSASSADLVVWWEKGFYEQEDEAVAEIVAAFEQDTGKEVELVHHSNEELPEQLVAALEAGRPPDFAFGLWLSEYSAKWAFEDRLVDLSDVVGHFADLFDPDALHWVMLLNARTQQRALYAVPIARATNYLHVWKSLLERAGLSLADIPREWDTFWSFWCDQVQPAVREATGRDDIWGMGLPMEGGPGDTGIEWKQFVSAYDADYVTPDGRLVIDDPAIRDKLVQAIDSYTAIYRRGCTPPESMNWSGLGNNEAFLAQTVVMTPNLTLSIPNALKRERPDDYYEKVVTIEWPLGPRGEPFAIVGDLFPAVVFKDGGNTAAAEEFVRFLVAEGWLMHYLNFSGERFLPPISKLLDQPFWLDPSDPHRMAAVMQISSRPLLHNYATVSGDWRHEMVEAEFVWEKAIHRIVTEDITPEQAVDEAIARIEEILAE
jgi:multiple sugar transport system substrate-binding protein